MNKSDFKTGVYQHYKGVKYLVIGLAKHSGTMEDMVIYVCLYENKRSGQHMWVRPLSEFGIDKEKDGKTIKNFEYIGGY